MRLATCRLAANASSNKAPSGDEIGGDDGIRTHDLLSAIQPLFRAELRHHVGERARERHCPYLGPNFQPVPYDASLPVGGEHQRDSVLDYEDRPDAPIGNSQKSGIDSLSLAVNDRHGEETCEHQEGIEEQLHAAVRRYGTHLISIALHETPRAVIRRWSPRSHLPGLDTLGNPAARLDFFPP